MIKFVSGNILDAKVDVRDSMFVLYNGTTEANRRTAIDYALGHPAREAGLLGQ